LGLESGSTCPSPCCAWWRRSRATTDAIDSRLKFSGLLDATVRVPPCAWLVASHQMEMPRRCDQKHWRERRAWEALRGTAVSRWYGGTVATDAVAPRSASSGGSRSCSSFL